MALITIITSSSITNGDMLRTFVGSVHYWHPELLIIIYGCGVNHDTARQLVHDIETWDSVVYVEIPSYVGLVSSYTILEYSFRFSPTVWLVKPYVQFRGPVMHSVHESTMSNGAYYGTLDESDDGGGNDCTVDVTGFISLRALRANAVHLPTFLRVGVGTNLSASLVSGGPLTTNAQCIRMVQNDNVRRQSTVIRRTQRVFLLFNEEEGSPQHALSYASSGSSSGSKDTTTTHVHLVKRVSRSASGFLLQPVNDKSLTVTSDLEVRLLFGKRSYVSVKDDTHLVGTSLIKDATVFRVRSQSDRHSAMNLLGARVTFEQKTSHKSIGWSGNRVVLSTTPSVFMLKSAEAYNTKIRARQAPLTDVLLSKTPVRSARSKSRASMNDHNNGDVADPLSTIKTKGRERKGAPFRIAIIVSTIAPNGVHEVSKLPFVTIFLKSFKRTIDPISVQQQRDYSFNYTIYLGFDKGDRLYDSAANQKELHNIVATELRGYPVQLELRRQSGTKGAPAWVWDNLAHLAMKDGAEYLYQANDDLDFKSSMWSEAFVNTMLSYKHPNFGVVAPDCDNQRILTQTFVSRLHMEFIGNYYPRDFKNWFTDDWITELYCPTYCKRIKPVKIVNTNAYGQRYEPNRGDVTLLRGLVDKHRARIPKFLKQHYASSE